MFKGRKTDKTATPCVTGVADLDARYSKVREHVPYEPLLVNEYPDGSFRVLSDVDLLFNQHRLDRMSLAALKQKLDESVQAGDNGLSELRKNIKDEDLQRFIKSRYIQSLSELRQWSSYLTSEYARVVDSIRASQKPAVAPTSPTGAAPAVPSGNAPAAPSGNGSAE